MKTFLSFTCAFLIAQLFAADWYVNDASTAGDIYTSNYGNNGNPGTSIAPFGTLTYAISQASSGDNIYVDAGYYYRTDHSITVNGINLNIIGAGSDLTIFDNDFNGTQEFFMLILNCTNFNVTGIRCTGYDFEAGSRGKAFTVQNSTIVFDDVSLVNNQENAEPALLIGNNTNVTYQNSVSACNLQAGSYGGGIGVGTPAIDVSNVNFTLINSTVSHNQKSSDNGGGLSVYGNSNVNITITNTLFYNNGGVNGGGIFVNDADDADRTVLTINNSCFTENYLAGGSNPGYGGAIRIWDNVTLNLNHCSFTNNLALSGTGSSDGGAIAVYGQRCTANIYNCYFTGNNCADDGEAIFIDRDFSAGTAEVNIDESYFDAGQDVYIKGTGTFLNINNSGSISVRTTSNGEVVNNINAPQNLGMPVTSCDAEMTCGEILPAEGLTLGGEMNKNGNKLFWTTLSEKNTDKHFLYGRGQSDKEFKIIGTLNAAGNSNQTQRYAYNHQYVSEPYYYKVVVLDFDGKTTTTSNIIYLDVETSDFKILSQLDKFVKITYAKDGDVEVFDINGRLIHQTSINQNEVTELDLRSFKDGVYLIRVDQQAKKIFLK